MKALMKKIDLFCYKHPRFGIPNLMIFIVIGNALVWLFSMMDTTGMLTSYLMFSPYHILRGQIWRLVTFAIIPNATGILFLAISLYFYYFIGTTLEREWGTGRFTIYYFFGIIITVIFGFIVYFVSGMTVSLSATYINLSMFFAFATLFPDQQVLLFFIIPIKMKWLAILDALVFAYEILSGFAYFPANLLPLIAIANYFLFCGDTIFSLFGSGRVKNARRVADFRQKVRNANIESSSRGYNRKCEICGKTDTQFPNLEFRYCSRCEGFHCYCMEHINNHTHVKE